MPRIDLWAVDTPHQVDKMESDPGLTSHVLSEEKESSLVHSQVIEQGNGSCDAAGMAGQQEITKLASRSWSSFVEQVDSICVSTTLMILATSEVPYPALPLRIRQFFKLDISNCSHSSPPEHTVPRFTVQVDGYFNHDMMINSSATKLSRDVVQQFVQLIHHRTHINTSSSMEYKACDTIESNADVVCHNADHSSANEHEGRRHCSEDSLIKVLPQSNNRTVKGKSSLLLAISTFGYQILRYPHFAELCWVTSKLKDGPWADINGPWKGWPFNSCIVRPHDSLEKVAIACRSSNIKSKEKSGFVRGLMAVGLSAYRGAYTSLKQVSFEVRKVLELLVGQINSKIQAGKDRYQFVRLLSQVAYLEDMVDSWAYSLQSLELDAQGTVTNPKLPTVGSPDNNGVCVDNPVQGEECRPNACKIGSLEPKVPEEGPQGFAAENIEHLDANSGDGFGNLNSGGRVAMPEEGPSQQMVFLGHSVSDTHIRSFPASAADQLNGKILNEHNGANSESWPENPGNHAVVDEGSRSLKLSNGFAFTESAAVSVDGICNSDKMGGVKLSSASKVCNQINGLSLTEAGIPSENGKAHPNEHIISSNKTTNLSAGTGFVCLYHCCSECLSNLHGLMQKVLMRELGNRSYQNVEDVHYGVASLSMSLLSAFRKACVAESFRNSFDRKPRHENNGKFECQCKKSENGLVMPMKCSCHLIREGSTTTENSSSNHQLELDAKFIYRDGVLAHADPDKDISFHCKFETLCLCLLIEWMVMTKRPFD